MIINGFIIAALFSNYTKRAPAVLSHIGSTSGRGRKSELIKEDGGFYHTPTKMHIGVIFLAHFIDSSKKIKSSVKKQEITCGKVTLLHTVIML